MFIDLLRPLPAGSELDMILHLTQRGFDPSKQSGVALAFPDVIPVGASQRSGTLTVRVSPAFQALGPQPMPESELKGPILPSIRGGRNTWRYSYIGSAPTGKLQLRLGSPRLKIVSDTRVYRVEGRAETTTRLQLRPDVSGLRNLTLVTWVPMTDSCSAKPFPGITPLLPCIVSRSPRSPSSRDWEEPMDSIAPCVPRHREPMSGGK